ncbi:MAG: deoxyguanosinetriphosphate triphosphohydrolase [Chloroflexi bacterium]|nr:deoxyguanosinetriphosphate triphosphohydrolase [Chloroflexota bacterium]
MLVTREAQEENESRTLASYATLSRDSRGRRFPQEPASHRTEFQRDRDRIIHSAAFRRLEYKTQVFLSFEGEYYRTRLTHTIEATQIAQSIARALGANPDLTEAISLAHDLGHSPFGHAGEAALDEAMAAHGGFDHNRQSLRIVDDLELRYPGHSGLNLSWEVREGIAKHVPGPILSPEFADGACPSLEAQVANIADDIAYSCHDLDDGLRSRLLSGAQIEKAGVALWQEAIEAISARYGALDAETQRHAATRYLVDRLIADVIDNTELTLRREGLGSPTAVRQRPSDIVAFSTELQPKIDALRAFLFHNLYQHTEVVRMSEKAKRLLTTLFLEFRRQPRQLPESVLAAAKKTESLERAICDYLASLTDRYAVLESRRLFDFDVVVLP